MKDLKGNKYGRLTVVGESVSFKNSQGRTERKWLCRCECGAEKYILERSLLSGGAKSCGCAARENSAKAKAHQLKGMVFGELTVLDIAEDIPKSSGAGRRWLCRCSCGGECVVLGSLLVTGRKTHCGCKTERKYHYEDISGKRFGDLTALYPMEERDKKGSVFWLCQCDCGNKVKATYNKLMYTNIRSCGCRKQQHNEKMQSFLTRVDGTSIDMIKSKKLPAGNTTGVKGVGFYKGKYFAKIVFQKKQYHLGKYDSIEEAARVRREAEELLFKGAADHYEKWKERAVADPNWGEENPVRVIVSKKGTGDLSVSFLPKLA